MMFCLNILRFGSCFENTVQSVLKKLWLPTNAYMIVEATPLFWVRGLGEVTDIVERRCTL